MKIKKLYDKVANTYNQGQSSEVLAKSNARALEMTLQQSASIDSILSLGIGDGLYLTEYVEAYPSVKIHGLDISMNMLEKARQRFQCDITQGDALNVSALIPDKKFSMVHAHFIAAYVPLPDVLEQCKSLLVDDGMVSVVSNTLGSFPRLRALLPKFERSRNPFYRLIAKHVNETIAKIFVPKNREQFEAMTTACGYKIKAISVEKLPICLNTEEEVFDFFINGGWFVSALDHPLVSDVLLRRLTRRMIAKHLNLPYRDNLEVIVGLVEKAPL